MTSRRSNQSRVARGPQPVAQVISEIMMRRRMGGELTAAARRQAWQDAVGSEIAQQSHCGSVRRGKLEVVVASSLLVQELTFRKGEIVANLQTAVPDWQVNDLRIRVGSLPGNERS